MEGNRNEELLEAIARNTRRTGLFAGISALCTAVIAITLILSYLRVIPGIEKTINDMQTLIPQVEQAIADTSEMMESTNRLVTENEENVAGALEKINAIDFESLNRSITKLEEVIGSLQKIVEGFSIGNTIKSGIFGGQ